MARDSDRSTAITAGVASAVWMTVVGCALGFGAGDWAGLLIAGGAGALLGILHGWAVGAGRAYDLNSPRGAGLFFVDHTWSIPNTAVGTVWLGLNLLFGNRLDRTFTAHRNHIGLVNGPIKFGGLEFATTIGTVQAGTTLDVNRHEAIHVLQARLFGPLYLPLVIVNYVLATVVPYWLLYHDRKTSPIDGVGAYFTRGVYPHVWNEEWAYRIEGSPP